MLTRVKTNFTNGDYSLRNHTYVGLLIIILISSGFLCANATTDEPPALIRKGNSTVINKGVDDVIKVIIKSQDPKQQIGDPNFLPISFFEKANEVQKSVARISGMGFGNATAFLVSPNWLMTNRHVIDSLDDLKGAKVDFNYGLRADGSKLPVDTYRVNETLFFKSDKYDYALVKSIGTPGDNWPYLSLNESYPEPEIGDLMNIIQHPEGGYKQIVIHDNKVIGLTPEGDLLYKTDTLRGSSGSPVFDNNWSLVGIHHYSGLPDNKGVVSYNEGIQIKDVVKDLQTVLEVSEDGRKLLSQLGI